MVLPHDLSQEPLEPPSPAKNIFAISELGANLFVDCRCSDNRHRYNPLNDDRSLVKFRWGDSHEFKMTFHRRF